MWIGLSGAKTFGKAQARLADRPQTVRRNADAGIARQVLESCLRTLPQLAEPLRIIAEAYLPRPQRAAVAAAMFVEHRQQRQSDAGRGRSGGNPRRKFSRIVIRRTAGLVVEVVEFGHRRVSRLQHLHLHEGGDGLHVIRC